MTATRTGMRRGFGDGGSSLYDATRRVTGKPTLTELEEVMGIRGWLRRHDNGLERPLAMVNKKFGTRFNKREPALEFMDAKVEEARQTARARAAAFRKDEE